MAPSSLMFAVSDDGWRWANGDSRLLSLPYEPTLGVCAEQALPGTGRLHFRFHRCGPTRRLEAATTNEGLIAAPHAEILWSCSRPDFMHVREANSSCSLRQK